MSVFEATANSLYHAFVEPLVRDPLRRQRIKLAWYVWGYWHLFKSAGSVSLAERLGLLWRFLRVDWHVLHGHSPSEVAQIAVAAFRNGHGESGTFVEAGCWNGGSSSKFSHICAMLGYQLHIYDSFQGVEDVSSVPGEWDYSGQYSAAEGTVRKNIQLFGRPEVCTFHPGWFSDTLARDGAVGPVKVAYIDCDIAKGTKEALQGIMPNLSDGGLLYSQDYHISPVRNLLNNPDTWDRFSVPVPQVRQLARRLAVFAWPQTS
jgi:O-methyltransferase